MKILSLLFIFLAVTFSGAAVAPMIGLSPYVGGGLALAASFIKTSDSVGVAFAGLNQEIWTPILVEQLRGTEEAMFLNELPDESQYVFASPTGENEVINLTDIGADPNVLLNNTAYPLPIVSQTDSNIAISLDKYQTEATSITDDEIQYLSYDKIGKVTEKHRLAIMREKHTKALHSLSPSTDTAATPVILTTGDDDGTGRRKMVMKDLISLKRRFDSQKMPLMGRVLVLSSEHYNDLLEEADGKPIFQSSIADNENGLLSARLHGFKIYWFVESPYYTPGTLTKLSYGAVPAATDRQASTAFYAPDMFKANGSTTPYADPAKPLYQRTLFNMRHYYIALPKKQRSMGAIVSDNI